MLTFISNALVRTHSNCGGGRGSRAHPRVSPMVCSMSPPSRAVSRRDALQLSAALLAAAILPKSASHAETADLTKLGEVVRDELHGFEYRPPSEGWSQQSATISSGRVASIYIRDADGDTNVNVVATPVSSDFQMLTSFGGMDKVVVCPRWSLFMFSQYYVTYWVFASKLTISSLQYVFLSSCVIR